MNGSSIEKSSFGALPDGTPVDLYTLRSPRLEASITNYGCAIVSLRVPDARGVLGDVALGFDRLEGYLGKDNPYFGCVIGRYANRIDRGRFVLDGREYVLARNNGANHIHGGTRGFDKVVWAARAMADSGSPKLELSYLSPDGDEGYPGDLSAQVTYALTADALRIEYKATTDRPTLCNLTSHWYVNLEGEGSDTVLDHRLLLNASRFTPVAPGLIPTGEIRSVTGTPFDFRALTRIGDGIGVADPQLELAGGYDQNWVIDRSGDPPWFCARVVAPRSGRTMEVYTTEPGVQFYAGNFLDGTV
ncbi:MAG TPA: aldose epimerase family protein, partial [Anaeromyxobacter sp.]|nr:aldose epimerase family protein [Anaeromyxobacter sp.]